MQYGKNQVKGVFNRLQSREREEPKILEPSNLDPIRKVISKRNREARKRRTDWMSSHLGAYSAGVITEQSQKSLASAPMFQFQTVSLNSGRYRTGHVDYGFDDIKVSIWEANFQFLRS